MRSSSISDSVTVAHEAVATSLQPGALILVERPLPLSEDLVVSVLLGQLHPKVESRSTQQAKQSREGGLAAPRLIRRQCRLGDPDQLGERSLGQSQSRARRQQQSACDLLVERSHDL